MLLFFSTGAGSGIGRAACRLLNREGATIIAADRNVEAAKEVAKSLNGDNQYIELEVSSKQSIQNGIQNIVSKFNAPPSIVVNAAGITKDNFLLKLEEDQFDDVIRVNLKVKKYIFIFLFASIETVEFHFQGTFLIMQNCANAMVEKNVTNGTIINLGSISSKIGTDPQANAYRSLTSQRSVT